MYPFIFNQVNKTSKTEHLNKNTSNNKYSFFQDSIFLKGNGDKSSTVFSDSVTPSDTSLNFSLLSVNYQNQQTQNIKINTTLSDTSTLNSPPLNYNNVNDSDTSISTNQSTKQTPKQTQPPNQPPKQTLNQPPKQTPNQPPKQTPKQTPKQNINSNVTLSDTSPVNSSYLNYDNNSDTSITKIHQTLNQPPKQTPNQPPKQTQSQPPKQNIKSNVTLSDTSPVNSSYLNYDNNSDTSITKIHQSPKQNIKSNTTLSDTSTTSSAYPSNVERLTATSETTNGNQVVNKLRETYDTTSETSLVAPYYLQKKTNKYYLTKL